MKETDGQLVSDYLEGNEKALGFLIERYLKDVYNFAFKLTGDLQAAEDIAQDSFIKAWKHIRRYHQGGRYPFPQTHSPCSKGQPGWLIDCLIFRPWQMVE